MRLLILFIVAAMITGCGTNARLARQKADAQTAVASAKADYVNCLKANAGDESKCPLEKKVFEANLKVDQVTRAPQRPTQVYHLN